jgi:hypothetical protein
MVDSPFVLVNCKLLIDSPFVASTGYERDFNFEGRDHEEKAGDPNM